MLSLVLGEFNIKDTIESVIARNPPRLGGSISDSGVIPVSASSILILQVMARSCKHILIMSYKLALTVHSWTHLEEAFPVLLQL